MDINPDNPIQLKDQAKNADRVKQEKLHHACMEFEAIILEKLISGMRESIPEGGLYEESYAGDMFQSMHDRGLSRELAHSRGTGLGEILFQQLLESKNRNY
ncbi:MAG: rod-binding protein [Desulfobia sp.]